MSDHVSIKHVLSNATPRESMDPQQSLWMAHWMQTSQNPLSQVHQHQTIHGEKREEDHDTEQGSMPLQIVTSQNAKRVDSDVSVGDISECNNKWKHRQGDFEIPSDVLQLAKVVPDTRKFEIRNKSLMNSKDFVSPGSNSAQLDLLSIGKLCRSSVHHEDFNTSSFPYFRNKSSECQTFQKSGLNKKMEDMLSPSLCDRFRPQLDNKSKYGAADTGMTVSHSPPRVLTFPPNEIHFKTEDKQATSKHQIELDYFEPPVRPLHDNHTVSNFNSMLFKFRGPHRIREGDPSSLELSHKGHLGNTHFSHTEPEHCNRRSYSTFLASETKMDQKLIGESSRSRCSGQKDGAVQLNDFPVIGDFQFPILLGDQGRKMKKISGLLPSCSSNQEALLEVSKCQQHLLHRMPICCFHDMETLRICPTVDSVEGVPGGLTKFSKTTHHLFFTKKADMNFSKGDQMTKESTDSAELKGNALHKMLALHPGFCCYSEQEPNFRHVVKLADSEEKEDVNTAMLADSEEKEDVNTAMLADSEEKEDVNTAMTVLQNESSAETKSMPIDFHQSKNNPCGIASSLLHEDHFVGKGKGKSPVAAVSQSKEAGMRKETAELPGMSGEELRADSAAHRCVDSRERSTSRTESLDVEHLLSHVEYPENSNSSPQQCNRLYPEPSSRWVKRLKLSTSGSHAFGTKCLKMGDASSSDKVNKLLNRITSYSRTNSEPTLHVCHGKGLKQFDKTSIVLRNMNSSEGLVKDHSDLSLSHSWIRRWCRSRETTTKSRPAPQVAYEPEDSKFLLEEIQKKQFPSIAAMALMGKAVTSFRPCEFRKKGGSLVVWNTDGF